ncbi:type I toxin-antitoxin system Fst family toxin [Enterococcus wangshanyuanii]
MRKQSLIVGMVIALFKHWLDNWKRLRAKNKPHHLDE